MQQTQVRPSAGGDFEEYGRLLAREPDSLRFAEYADLLRRAGQLADAREVCERGLARYPGYPTGRVVMGDILSDLGKPAEAEGEWRQALTLDPGHPLAHVRLGSLYLSRGDTERAAAAFEAALIYSPAHDEARAKLTEMRGADPLPRESAADGPDADRRRPGDRPAWLTDERTRDFVARLAASPCIDSAAVVDGEGAIQALSGERSAAGRMGPAGVAFAGEAISLLRRLGAGRLRSALIRGGALCLRIVPVGEWTLIVAATPGGPVGEVDTEIEGALADEPPNSADEGDYE